MDFSTLVFPFFLQKLGLKAMKEDRQADSLDAGLLQGLINSAITHCQPSHTAKLKSENRQPNHFSISM